MKYDILERIIKGVIFEKKQLRESFMQEILNASDNASLRVCLEAYINIQDMSVPEFNPETGMLEKNDHERIIEMSVVDMNNSIFEFEPNV